MLCHPPTHVRAGRYRTRTAAEPTAACGGNREARLGQRSDFSRPRQGVAEKSASATRKARRYTSRRQKGPCGAFLDARLANPQLSHNCLVSPNGDDRVELFVICSFPIGHAGGFEPKKRGTPHTGHASVFLMFLFCYLTLPCAPAAAGTNRTRCSARRPPAWKWGPPGRSWSGWRSAGCS